MVTRFEDLVAWQKARTLAKSIYLITRTLPLSRDYRLSSQLQSAAVSIMSNIAEGFERSKLKEFHQFLSVAKSSCAEVRSQLYLLYDVEYVSEGSFRRLMSQAEEVGKIIGGLRASVERMIQR